MSLLCEADSSYRLLNYAICIDHLGPTHIYVEFGIYRMLATHCALVPLIAECIPLDVSLDIIFIKLYRNASRSDNDVIKYLANRAILSYESPMGKNIRFIMSKYVINIHDMISLPMNTLRCTCINNLQ